MALSSTDRTFNLDQLRRRMPAQTELKVLIEDLYTLGDLVNVTTPGIVEASKALVVDASKNLGAIAALTVSANLDIGSTAGQAGTLDIFPTTAAKGKAAFSVTDNAGDTTTGIVIGAQAGARTYTVPDAGAAANFALNLANEAQVKTAGVSFTEDGSTTFTATVEIPAGTLIHRVGFTSPVLWNDSGAVAAIVGDDDDPNGWFASTDLKATALLVGEVLEANDDGTWGGVPGAYLTAAGRRGRVTAGVDSGWYCGAATEVIFVITAANGDGSAGRSFGWVSYSTPTFVASINT